MRYICEIALLIFCLSLALYAYTEDNYSSRIYSFPKVEKLNTELDNVYNKIRTLNMNCAKKGGVTSTYTLTDSAGDTTTVNTVTIVINGTTYTLLTK